MGASPRCHVSRITSTIAMTQAENNVLRCTRPSQPSGSSQDLSGQPSCTCTPGADVGLL
ncbi:hypothetical protein PAXRUDRAFT_830620 [Paxillus rubicundulus Ve08.2h10]|uniref:Uncharacterized protein n=1 Tax=Paxillus rubicundulus Ve08.2h10 TaxID=930991 RepID=A0A0D0DKG2_9AGAM|nr:hypothetical protein PAXRUDRAFT_830620 [Paxillus rubicundulus Ve08.2h10]